MELKRHFAKTWSQRAQTWSTKLWKLKVTGNSGPQFMSKVLIFIQCDFQNYITAS